jgi:hypothetical protein
MWHHNKSIAQAIYDLFPEIGFDKAKLQNLDMIPFTARTFYPFYNLIVFLFIWF